MRGVGVVIMVLVCLGLVVGCASLNNPAVRQLAVTKAQKALADEGMSATADEIGMWYDALVASKELAAIVQQAAENASVSNRAMEILNENLGAVAPVPGE